MERPETPHAPDSPSRNAPESAPEVLRFFIHHAPGEEAEALRFPWLSGCECGWRRRDSSYLHAEHVIAEHARHEHRGVPFRSAPYEAFPEHAPDATKHGAPEHPEPFLVARIWQARRECRQRKATPEYLVISEHLWQQLLKETGYEGMPPGRLEEVVLGMKVIRIKHPQVVEVVGSFRS